MSTKFKIKFEIKSLNIVNNSFTLYLHSNPEDSKPYKFALYSLLTMLCISISINLINNYIDNIKPILEHKSQKLSHLPIYQCADIHIGPIGSSPDQLLYKQDESWMMRGYFLLHFIYFGRLQTKTIFSGLGLLIKD